MVLSVWTFLFLNTAQLRASSPSLSLSLSFSFRSFSHGSSIVSNETMVDSRPLLRHAAFVPCNLGRMRRAHSKGRRREGTPSAPRVRVKN